MDREGERGMEDWRGLTEYMVCLFDDLHEEVKMGKKMKKDDWRIEV